VWKHRVATAEWCRSECLYIDRKDVYRTCKTTAVVNGDSCLGITDRPSKDLESVNFYVQALVAIGHSFSPNSDAKLLTSLPFKVSDGQVRTAQPGLDQWKSRMPIYMVEDYIKALKQLRGLRFDSAFEDEYSHIPSTSREFSAVLTEHGIEHTFEMYNGDHRNRLWGNQGRLYTEMLPFISSLLESQ